LSPNFTARGWIAGISFGMMSRLVFFRAFAGKRPAGQGKDPARGKSFSDHVRKDARR